MNPSSRTVSIPAVVALLVAAAACYIVGFLVDITAVRAVLFAAGIALIMGVVVLMQLAVNRRRRGRQS